MPYSFPPKISVPLPTTVREGSAVVNALHRVGSLDRYRWCWYDAHMKKAVLYLAVPFGDPAGIGPEIVLKAMHRAELDEQVGVVVIGDAPVFSKTASDLGLNEDFDSVVSDDAGLARAIEARSRRILYTQKVVDMNHFSYGTISAMCGRAAYRSAETAVRLVKQGFADAIVTPPLHKEALNFAQI